MSRLGRDERKPAAPFVRVVSPSDVQVLVADMVPVIRDYHDGFDYANIGLWRKLGFFAMSENNPVYIFLRRLMLETSKRETPLTDATAPEYKAILQSEYNYSESDINDYIRAYLELREAGRVPDSIHFPFDYEPSTFVEDIVGASKPKMLFFVLGLVAVWGLSTTFISQTGDAIKGD